MKNEIASKFGEPNVRCSKCRWIYPINNWRENNGCNNVKCSSKKAILLAADENNFVNTYGNKITFVSNAMDIRLPMIFTTIFVLITGTFSFHFDRLGRINGNGSVLGTILLALMIGAGIVLILEAIVYRGGRKKIILNGETKSIDVQTTIISRVLSEKKEFRKMDDIVEVLLRVEEDTCEEFAEYVRQCNLKENEIPFIIFKCDLLCEDQLLINLFEFFFADVDDFTAVHYRSKLLSSNRDEPYSFLSIIRTAGEIAQILDVPLRMVYKDSVEKGKESETYADL